LRLWNGSQDLGRGGRPNADGSGSQSTHQALTCGVLHQLELRALWKNCNAPGKCQKSTHVFVCPCLMSYSWRRQLFKEADLVFHVPAGAGVFWPASCHEPLIIGVCVPFISEQPWKLQGTPKTLGMGRKLHCVLADGEGDPRVVLQELLELLRKVEGLWPSVVHQVLQF